MTWRIILQLALSGLSIGSIYALVGLALVLPFKASGIVNFAQGEIVTFGAYLALILSGLGLPYLAVVPLVLVGAAMFGMATERLLIRPIANQSEFTLVIVTFAIGFIIKAAIRLHWQDNTFSIDAPFVGPPLALGALRLNPAYLVFILSTVVVVAALFLFFGYSKFGKAMRATALDPIAAKLMGIRIGSVFSAAWALSTMLGAFVGLLLAPVIGINPEIGHLILKGLVAAVIGGFSSLGGAVVGGLLLGLLETYAGAFFGATFKNLVPFGVLILLLLLRPQGLAGASSVRRV
ncbi:branched-chain amino acid ABC transporter permease [Bradyrhizobium sp.]|jgi:branched-chain amino acid transport system permease protein|uniref:branched-chain amino acid ABC transporter permease n=1 Tax=Bradyrhizobium sp. TaxID=376 RepID=UPI003C1D4112